MRIDTWQPRVAGLGLVVLVLCGCRNPREEPNVGEPLRELTDEQLAQFKAGREVFMRRFTPEQGLGPLFNATGCIECHGVPKPGGSSAITEIHATLFIPPDICDPLFQEGGPVVQQLATPLLQALGVDGEGIPPSASGQGLRSSPAVFGFGLIDAIPEETILARADPDDADGDGISGRVNRFIDGRVGRFGRKAFIPGLFDFNAGALPIEHGITTPLTPVEETINGQPVPPESDPVPEPELSLEEVEILDAFVRFLAPPPRDTPTHGPKRKKVQRGEMLFRDIGCTSCHVPAMLTGPHEVLALSDKCVPLYSDLLLHDMGPELADICLGLATPSEFRTEILMGLRFRKQFLHDGSASTVREAVERHGGEAAASRDAFLALDPEDQEAILAFLDSL